MIHGEGPCVNETIGGIRNFKRKLCVVREGISNGTRERIFGYSKSHNLEDRLKTIEFVERSSSIDGKEFRNGNFEFIRRENVLRTHSVVRLAAAADGSQRTGPYSKIGRTKVKYRALRGIMMRLNSRDMRLINTRSLRVLRLEWAYLRIMIGST